jgi:hypothetical protein
MRFYPMNHTLPEMKEILRCLMMNSHLANYEIRLKLIKTYKDIIEDMERGK